jgi:hypothetical protein
MVQMNSSTVSRTLLGLFASLAPAALSAQISASAASTSARVENVAADSSAPSAEASRRSLSPWADYGDAGIAVGGSVAWTRHEIGREPFAGRDRLRLEYAPMESAAALDYLHTTNHAGGTVLTVHARASRIERFAFYGWGNDTDGSASRDDYRVDQDAVTLEAEVSRPLAAGLRLGIGPVVRYRAASVEDGTPLGDVAPLGTEEYTTGGIRTALSWDRRDDAVLPRRGGWVELAGEAHQGLAGDTDQAFARMRGEGAAYLPVLSATTLVVRAGGEQLWGSFPVQEAAFLGGQGSLRGLPRGRFAGDASAWGNAELRTGLGRTDLRVARGDVGVLALADAGRVFVDGESQGAWHTAYGAGVYFSTLDRALTTTVLAAHGEDGWRAYLRMGLPF